MKSYNQSDLFWLLVSAARNNAQVPDAGLLQRYKEKRIQRAIKSLRSQNIFLYTEGTRPSVNLNDLTTIYTQPAGTRLLVVGYSDNLMYGAARQNIGGNYGNVVFPQAHRVRVVGGESKPLSDDLVMAQAGVSGQPRFTSTLLPVPFILEPNEQIAIDLGYDTAMSAPVAIPPQAFTFFCLKIKDQLTPDDLITLEAIKSYIANHDYQRGIFLNCFTQVGQIGVNEDVEFSTAIAGGVALCETRPANGPLLITGICTSLLASTVLITDTGTSQSFSLNRAMRFSSLSIPDIVATNAPPVTVRAGAPIWAHYFDFPMPHLLKPGAALRCDMVNGGTDALGTARLDTQTGNFILFQGVTV